MSEYRTDFGSIGSYTKGEIEIIDDDPKHYAFSNVFEVAARAAPYEKTVVARQLEYVVEVLRAEGASSWFAAPHDEFALVMDGEIDIDFMQLDDADSVLPAGTTGAVALESRPAGQSMGWMRLRRGHQALLPAASAYRFRCERGLGVIVLQTKLGRHSVEKWRDICST